MEKLKIMSITVKNLLFYGGTDKASLYEVRKNIDEANRVLATIMSLAATILIAVLFLFSTKEIVKDSGINRVACSVGTAISLAILIASVTIAKKHPKAVGSLVHISYLVYYTYGIVIGTVIVPEEKSVVFIGLIILLPVLFTIPPIQTISITIVCITVYIVISGQTKPVAIANKDTANTIIWGLLGLISGIVLTRMKVRGYVKAYELNIKAQELSSANKKLAKANAKLASLNETLAESNRTDKLTKLNNRNAYEHDLAIIPGEAKKTLGCVYVDVNGLKVLNDNIGHSAGDEMLRTVAEKIIKHFGNERTYRIGGDEFVIFIPDMSEENIKKRLEKMEADIKKHNYHIAIGYEYAKKSKKLNIAEIQKSAEFKMYQAKTEFYKNSSFDRRRC